MPRPVATLTLVGGPTVLVEAGGLRFLTDPTFDPPGLQQTAPVRLEKTQPPALGLAEIGPIDAVLLSHDQHLDNLDAAGRAMLPGAQAVYTTPAGAGRLGGNAIGLAPFETLAFDPGGRGRAFVTGTPARHGPVGIEPISGDVTGFLLGFEEPGDAIYVTGDTVWYPGVAEVARRFSPKLVIVFAGSAQPRGPFHVTMDSNDAIEVAHAFPGAAIAGVHNEGWAHFKEGSADLAASFATLGLSSRLLTLEPGRPLAVPL